MTNKTNNLQDLSYTYDNVGNITRIIDSSETNANKTTDYSYDNLYRLTVASSTNAVNNQNFRQTYSYNAIGNITNKSDVGNYTYSSVGRTSPNAVTNINGINYSYSNNGNLISDGTWTHAWTYDNRLASSTNGSINLSYGYDYTGQRVKMTNGTDSYIYPNKYFNINNATTTKHIFANDQLIATIESNGIATSTYYTHADHLGGSSVITNESGLLAQTLEYYPFGDVRINEKEGSFDEQRKFTGHEYDEDTGLNYMVARYQSGSVGRFMSIDPAYHWIAQSDFEQKANRTLEEHLMDPQSLNSYSYVNNNPLRYTDPSGEIIPVLLASWAVAEFGLSAYDAFDLVKTFFSDASAKEKGITLGGFILGAIGPGGGYGKAGKAFVSNFDNVLKHVINGSRGGGLHVLENAIKQGKNVTELKQVGKAGVQVGKLEGRFKTFFPSSWTNNDLGESLKYLEKNHEIIEKNGNKYIESTGTFKDVRIEGTLNQKGEVTSFYQSANQ